jgi:hypothetical protein
MFKPVFIAFVALPASAFSVTSHAAAKPADDFMPCLALARSDFPAAPSSSFFPKHSLSHSWTAKADQTRNVAMAALSSSAKEIRLFLDSPEIEKIPARKATMILYHQVDTMTTSGIGKSNRQQTKD